MCRWMDCDEMVIFSSYLSNNCHKHGSRLKSCYTPNAFLDLIERWIDGLKSPKFKRVGPFCVKLRSNAQIVEVNARLVWSRALAR